MNEQKKTIYKRKDNRYEGRYIAGYIGIYGKAHYRSVYGRSQEEAIRLLEEAEQEVYEEVELERVMREQRKKTTRKGILEQALNPDSVKCISRIITVREWMIEWLENHKKNSIRPSSYMRYHGVIYNHIIPVLGKYKLADLTPVIILDFIHYLSEPLKDKKALSPTTIRSYIVILKGAFDSAMDQELLVKNPCCKIPLPNKNFKKPTFLEPEECKRLEYKLYHSDDNPKSVAILIALKTGLRLGELAALRWKDVNFKDRLFHVRHSIQRIKSYDDEGGPKTKLIVTETKTINSVRDIPMTEDQCDYLMVYKRIQRANSTCPINEKSFVFQSKGGSYIDPRVYQQYFKVILKKAKVKPVNFHALRHTFATIAASKNMQVSVLSRILGHANSSLTLKLYIHAVSGQDRAEMEKLKWSLFDIN